MAFTPLELLAVAFILANVWLAVKVNIWTWPTGIIGVLLYLVVNWRAHLYANALLQILYFVLSIHGWWEWLHGGEHRTERPIMRATAKVWAISIVAGLAIMLPIYWLLVRSGDSSSPVMDAGTTAYSIVGQVLLNLKYVENWIVWIAVDVVYVVIYAQQKLMLTAVLYALFVVMCIKGYVDWKKEPACAVS